MRFTPSALAVACALCAGSALAQTAVATANSPRTVYIQAGAGPDEVTTTVIGVTIPVRNIWWNVGSGTFRAHWDMYAGGWSSEEARNDRKVTKVVGIGPAFRWRADQGHSAGFFEIGSGLSMNNRYFLSGQERMSTKWNFASHIGLGMNFGEQREHELSVRWQHVSNAGFKKPNPGVDFFVLRYAHSF